MFKISNIFHNKTSHWSDYLKTATNNIIEMKYIDEIINDFLKRDNISEISYKSNYQVLLSYSDEKVYIKTTPTIKKFSFIDKPIFYENWFLAAYPDVVDWFQYLDEDKMSLILGTNRTNSFEKPDLKTLRKIVDSYLIIGKHLECSE